MRAYFRTHPRAPLAVAAFLAFPLFFESLMASSLRFDKPTVTKTVSAAGKVTITYGQSAASTELRIWVAALVPSAVLVAVGVAAMLWRRLGIYVACATAIVLAVVITIPLETWAKGHTARFPPGFDLVVDSDPSNLLARGEWEENARDTAVSLSHWTIGAAIGIAVIAAALTLRERIFGGKAPHPSSD